MIEKILSRRSERDYTGQIIPKDDIHKILECGFCAPSAHNYKPWSVIVIDDKDILKKIMQIHPYSTMLKNASHAVLVCGDKIKSEHFWQADCAAVTQNILLAAHSLGYGACWCGVTPIKQLIDPFSQLMDMPENVQIYSMVTLGVKASEKKANSNRYQEGLVHYNKW